MPRGIWDEILRARERLPRHCRSCGKRFHATLEAIKQDQALREEEDKTRSGGFLNTGF